jgi:hypothetical protein
VSGKSDQENRRDVGDFFISELKFFLASGPLSFWVYFIFVNGPDHVKLSHDHQFHSSLVYGCVMAAVAQ